MRQLALALTLALGAPAVAQPVVPDVSEALEAAEAGDWGTAQLRAAERGEVATDLLLWMRLRDGSAPFDMYMPFLEAHDDWPGLERAQAEAERKIPAGYSAEEVLEFFEERAPLTGEGLLRFARALEAEARSDEAEAAVVSAWRTMALDEDGEEALLDAYPDLLEEHHAERTDMLLWRWRTSDAERMLPRLSEDQRALAEARIALIRSSGDVDKKMDAVPDSLSDTPGLLYDEYNWLADHGRRTDAVEILAERSTSAEALGEPFRWSGWRRSLARWLMREGEAKQAYSLAANHFLEGGSEFADLEWLAGYIALTYLDQTDIALLHFQTMERAVSSPISEGRAWYWIGRAHEARGESDRAREAYAEGAKNQTAFYGLLAAEKLGQSLDPMLAGREEFPDWDESDLPQVDLVQAGLMLLEAGDRGLAVLFFARAGELLARPELGALGETLAAMEEPYFQILLGKTAARRGLIVPVNYHPLHQLATMDLPIDPAIALAIARQESEFRPDAGSSVGALGLMQLMPATAQEVSTSLGLDYSRGRLTSDWRYNATLGSSYLSGLQEEFGLTPVMMAAGYNAGPSRPMLWMGERGDPRSGETDVVDWIEHIPFRETRNYVQRVTEAIPIYRARISGRTGPVRFTDMLTGGKPLIRPRAREDLQDPLPVTAEAPQVTAPSQAATDDAEAGSDQAAPTAALASSLRPQLRPESIGRASTSNVSADRTSNSPEGPSGPSAPSGVSPVARQD